VIRGLGLSYRLEPDIGRAFLVAHLATFSNHHSGIDPPSLAILLAIFGGIELEDCETTLLAVAGGQTKILDSRFVAAIGASIDPSAGKALGERMRVEWCTTRNTISHDVLLKVF
jgi:hypothetical protein